MDSYTWYCIKRFLIAVFKVPVTVPLTILLFALAPFSVSDSPTALEIRTLFASQTEFIRIVSVILYIVLVDFMYGASTKHLSKVLETWRNLTLQIRYGDT